eukprot:PhM_4_TR14392/c0_g1_i1/m.10174
MPPKKPGGKKSGKKGKKGKKDKKKSAVDDEFEQILNEMFYISPEERQRKRQNLLDQIRSVFAVFEHEGSGACDVRELGTMVRALGFNPTEGHIRALQELVEDDETSTFVIGSKFEKEMLKMMLTQEFVVAKKPTTAVSPEEGATTTTTSAKAAAAAAAVDDDEQRGDLMSRDQEDLIMAAFNFVWEDRGKKIDADRQRYIEWDALRDLVVSMGGEEALKENEMQEMHNTASDPETGYVKEDYATSLALE